jgi:hypothetical protein
VQASIDAYLGSAERMTVLADVVWKVGVAVVVVVVLAWVHGALPGAVRLLYHAGRRCELRRLGGLSTRRDGRRMPRLTNALFDACLYPTRSCLGDMRR